MNKNIVPEDFTLALVLVDALPVIFFGASAITIGFLFHSFLYFVGSILCFFAGAAKVLWKLIVVLRKKNVWFLFMQMRIVMPLGFLCMISSVWMNRSKVRMVAILKGFFHFPSVIFFFAGVLGMVLMMVFAIKLDSSNLKANWIEQITNGIAQTCFFIGLVLLVI